jgi:hypothetical protein
VVGFYEYGDEPVGSAAMELVVNLKQFQIVFPLVTFPTQQQ